MGHPLVRFCFVKWMNKKMQCKACEGLKTAVYLK